jgi:hypothetical protein
MARKPLSDLSPAYRKRIESAERRGLTRTQARGHGGQQTEHQRKNERAKELGFKSRYDREKAHKQVLAALKPEQRADKSVVTVVLQVTDKVHGRHMVNGKPVIDIQYLEILKEWLEDAFYPAMHAIYG